MFRVRPGPPVDYSLCNQTVTLYHADLKNGFQCTRTLFRGAFFDAKKVQTVDKIGRQEANSFLLVLLHPGGMAVRCGWMWQRRSLLVQIKRCFPWRPGTRCFWERDRKLQTWLHGGDFIPASVPGLVVVKDVDVKYWNAAVCHIEAGG